MCFLTRYPADITKYFITELCFRGTLPSYTSGTVSGVYHPSSHPLHPTAHNTNKRPTSASQSNSSNSNSFRLKSDLGTRCSWKFVAIFFMLFSFLLVSALIYTAGEPGSEIQHSERNEFREPLDVFVLIIFRALRSHFHNFPNIIVGRRERKK